MAHPDSLPPVHPTDALVGHAPAVDALRAQIRHLAPFDTVGNPSVPTLLLLGETGTGKGLLARVIHDSGPRAQGPFIAVNCAAIPETLLEAELFGFEAGTFTDARQAKVGLFEAASGGTLFLDEIEALPLVLQPKLLTAIEEKQVRRLGAVATQRVDVKLIAATKEDLGRLAAAGRFRVDLYHRLAVVLLELPPLRTRGADSVLLAQHFVQHYAVAHGLPPQRLSAPAEAWLQHYNWPGNVRELSHLMERVMLLHPEAVVETSTLEQLVLRQPAAAQAPEAVSVRAASAPPDEATRLRHALLQTGGNVARAARLLGLNRNTVRYRMRRYGITRPDGEVLLPPAALPRPALAPPTPEAQEDTDARMLAPAWEQKPVAVLVLTVTFPQDTSGTAMHYDAWTVAARWEQMIDDKIGGFGGVVLQRAPPVLTAVFGVPRTLEQLPQRAVHTALAIHHLATEARAQAREEPVPEVRVAVHLGTVLVDVQAPAGAAQIVAVGDTFTVPVQLLGHTRAGDVLLSPRMGPQVEALYQLAARTLPLGPGASGAVAYTIIGPRSQLVPGTGWETRARSPLVGRERELAVLHERLRQVEDSQGQVVGVVGEPGMGKSRLLYEFAQSLRGQPVTYREGHCQAYAITTPYLLMHNLLQQLCGLGDADAPERIAASVDRYVRQVGMVPKEEAPVLLRLLDVLVDAPPLQLSPEAHKARTFALLLQVILYESRRQPLILAVENLHWIDAISEEWLATLVERLAGTAILLLVTYRPGCRPTWLDKSYATQLALPRLTPQESVMVVQAVAQTTLLPAHLTQGIIAKAAGNPFFLEQLTRSVKEAGRHHTALTIPDTIQAVLAARIDRLPSEEKRLLQTAAVIGTEVTLPLLQAIAELPEAALHRGLAHLQAAEFLYETRLFPESEYTFKHALTQQVAYETLLQERRRGLHAGIVEALEALAGDRVTEQVERLAHHAWQGEMWEKAVPYLRRAGTKAIAGAANREAVAHFERALVALQRLPESHITLEQAIDVRCELRTALLPLNERGRMFDILREAEALAEVLDDQRRLGRVSVLITHYLWTGRDLEHALATGHRVLDLATTLRDVSLQVMAYFVLGEVYYSLGDYQRAIGMLRRNVEALDHAGTQERFGEPALGPGLQAVASRRWLIQALADVGTFAEGLAIVEDALRLAEADGHPYTLVLAYGGVSYLHLGTGEVHKAIPLLDRSLELCRVWDLQQLRAGVVGAFSYALALSSRIPEALALLEQTAGQAPSASLTSSASLYAAWVSEVYLRAGHVADAHTLATQILARAREHKERGTEAWSLRLLGDIAMHRDPPEVEQAETHYQQAMALADELGMRPLVAHCHLGLGTLYVKIGRPEPARAELSAAIELYHAMDMTFWLGRAEAALISLSQADTAHEIPL